MTNLQKSTAANIWRLQTTLSPKSVMWPSEMYWPRKNTINTLHTRCLTLQKSRRLNKFIGCAYTRITCWETGKMLFVLTSATFTLVMIEEEYILYTTQIKNMIKTVWYWHSSSLLFMLWYRDVLWRGDKGSLIVLEYLEGKRGGINSVYYQKQ